MYFNFSLNRTNTAPPPKKNTHRAPSCLWRSWYGGLAPRCMQCCAVSSPTEMGARGLVFAVSHVMAPVGEIKNFFPSSEILSTKVRDRNSCIIK